MDLTPGADAPALHLTGHDGTAVDLAEMRGRRVVVYFYPKAFTPGCTTQACDFRDNLASLTADGTVVLGVSGDDVPTLARFHEEYALPYTLLSDPDHSAARAWGAWGLRTINGEESEGPLRSTFVVDPQGSLVGAEYRVEAQGGVARLREFLDGGPTGA